MFRLLIVKGVAIKPLFSLIVLATTIFNNIIIYFLNIFNFIINLKRLL
jgi:hypothetical protein